MQDKIVIPSLIPLVIDYSWDKYGTEVIMFPTEEEAEDELEKRFNEELKEELKILGWKEIEAT